MERETGFEPATSTLARSHSTTELFPLNELFFITKESFDVNPFFGKYSGRTGRQALVQDMEGLQGLLVSLVLINPFQISDNGRVEVGKFITGVLDVLTPTDVLSGAVKGFVSAVSIVMIGCYGGLAVEGGAEGVGRATTATVVWCTLTVVVLDTVLTTAFYG